MYQIYARMCDVKIYTHNSGELILIEFAYLFKTIGFVAISTNFTGFILLWWPSRDNNFVSDVQICKMDLAITHLILLPRLPESYFHWNEEMIS